MPDVTRVEDFFASYAAAWARNDAAAIAGHWAHESETIFYKAEEIAHVFTSFAEIKAYWAHNERFHERVRLLFADPTLMPLPGEYQVGFVKMRWDIEFKAGQKTFEDVDFNHGGKAMGGENHTFVLLKDVDGALKLTGWSETPDAPITYMAKLYEWAAAPDFKAR